MMRHKYLLSCLLLVCLSLLPSLFAEEYRIGFCFQGCPLGANPNNPLILRPIYALSFNLETKSADWVAYKVTAGSIGIASSLNRDPLPDNFVSDTLVSADFLELEGTGLVRSQYVPMVNFAATPYWYEVNYLTNAVARSSALNQGAWYGLEWAIRNLVNREGSVYIVTGPIYKAQPEVAQLNTGKIHRVPDAFYKIVVSEEGLATAFILEQSAPVHLHHCDLRAEILQIETMTGLKFFSLAATTNFAPLDSKLGCF